MEKKVDLREKSSVDDQTRLEEEIKIVAHLCKIGLKDSPKEPDELEIMIPSTIFSSIASNVKEQCPLISFLLETLVVGEHTLRNCGKKNNNYKFKSAMQMFVLSMKSAVRIQKEILLHCLD